MHPCLYFECEGSRVGQEDVAEFSRRMVAVANISTIDREARMLHCFDALLLARLLLLESFRAHIGDDAWDDTIHCKQWLIAQLNGATKVGLKLFQELCSASGLTVSYELTLVLERLQSRGIRVHFLFDEAHMWHNAKYGAYTTSENKPAQDSQRRTLFTKAVSLANIKSLPSLWVGTALSIGYLADSQSAMLVSGNHPVDWIVADFPLMKERDVHMALNHFLNASDSLLDTLSRELIGRGRLASEFIAACWKAGAKNDASVLKAFVEYRREVMTVIYYEDGATISVPDSPQREGDLRGCFPGQEPGERAGTEINPLLYRK